MRVRNRAPLKSFSRLFMTAISEVETKTIPLPPPFSSFESEAHKIDLLTEDTTEQRQTMKISNDKTQNEDRGHDFFFQCRLLPLSHYQEILFQSDCPSALPHIVLTASEDEQEDVSSISPRPLHTQDWKYLVALTPYEAWDIANTRYDDEDDMTEYQHSVASESNGEIIDLGRPDSPMPWNQEGVVGRYLPSLVMDDTDDSEDDWDSESLPDIDSDPWFVEAKARLNAEGIPC
ncbi:hypothetical protein BDN70DRAFT_934781 [Pholiota conissans]|uniref:Uncharacterized protein n=1 Tax=Pholiota conissans TaxID=109636 RepID=A0A9P5YY16_9AGAR|nr:hypothetical protein BDN70DRAFT_934781 [Pholiota conissans]